MSMMHLAARVFGRPLLMDAGKAAVIAEAIGPRLLGVDGLTVTGADAWPHMTGGARLGPLGDPLGRALASAGRTGFPVIDGVGVISIEGTLIAKGSWIGAYSGCTSYEGLIAQIGVARARPEVRGVVLDVDSPGGEADLAFAVADRLHALAREKPLLAILTETAASAGYLMASQARQVVIPEYGDAGSIGAVSLHVDQSRAIDAAGLTVTVMQAGARKTEGSPLQPLPEDVRTRITASLEAQRRTFAAAVARGRGSRMTVAAALATEAGLYRGREAVEAGLADEVADPFDAFDAFRAAIRAAG